MIRSAVLRLACLAGALCALPAGSVDLGVHGVVYEVVEPDIRGVIVEQLQQVDVTAIQKEMLDSTKKYFDTMPAVNIPRATTTKTRWWDPSVVIADDIKYPAKDARGEFYWEVAVAKGTVVNPLDSITMRERLLYFNANDKQQVAFAKAALQRYPDIVPIITAGNPDKLGKAWSRPVYFITPLEQSRYQLTGLPTFLTPTKPEGPYARRLAITTINLPEKTAILDLAWWGILDGVDVPAALRRIYK